MTGIVGNNGSVVRSFRSHGYGLTSHLFALARTYLALVFSHALLLTTASVEIYYYTIVPFTMAVFGILVFIINP